MPSMTFQHEIGAAPERVFEVFSDLRTMPERVRGVDAVEVLTEGPIRKGTVFRETRTMMGKQHTEEMTVTEFVPGRRITFEAHSSGMHYISSFGFEPSASGGTAVHFRMDAKGETLGGKIAGALMWLMMKKMMHSALEQDMEDLARACEGGRQTEGQPV